MAILPALEGQRGQFRFSRDPMSTNRGERQVYPDMEMLEKLLQRYGPPSPKTRAFGPSSLPEGTRGGGQFAGVAGPSIPGFEFASLLSPYALRNSPGGGMSDPLVHEAFSQLYARQNQRGQQGQLMDMLMQMLSGKGGGGLPKREDLLNPRLSDITSQSQRAREGVMGAATSQGRDINASPIQRRLAELSGTETTERQRAMGDVDLMLSQLGLGQQNSIMQLLLLLLGGGR